LAVVAIRLPKASYWYDHDPLEPVTPMSWLSALYVYVVVPLESVVDVMLPSLSYVYVVLPTRVYSFKSFVVYAVVTPLMMVWVRFPAES
jgi:hypothetical protein